MRGKRLPLCASILATYETIVAFVEQLRRCHLKEQCKLMALFCVANEAIGKELTATRHPQGKVDRVLDRQIQRHSVN